MNYWKCGYSSWVKYIYIYIYAVEYSLHVPYNKMHTMKEKQVPEERRAEASPHVLRDGERGIDLVGGSRVHSVISKHLWQHLGGMWASSQYPAGAEECLGHMHTCSGGWGHTAGKCSESLGVHGSLQSQQTHP